MTDANECSCDDVEQSLCNHVEPGKFTVLPAHLREHLDHCDRCWTFFCDLIILTGQLSRCAQSRDEAAGVATLQVESEVASASSLRNPIRQVDILEVERSKPMLEVFNRPVAQLPALVQPAVIHAVTITVPEQIIPEPKSNPQAPSIIRRVTIAAAAAVCVVAAAVCFQLLKPPEPAELPRHAQLAADAAKAFDAGHYDKVITLAQECFDSVEPAAVKLQKELEASGREIANGEVSSKVREELLSHGPLNDVAACYFYLGQAQRKLGHKEEAREAYTKAATFTCARVWDPEGEFFWAPADNTAHWLQVLSKDQ